MLKAGGSLVERLPESASGTTALFNIGNASSVDDVMRELGIPADQRVLVILNGTMVPRPDLASTLLANGDRLSLMPPIQAG
jgi:sulfur carrier protein ThiS